MIWKSLRSGAAPLGLLLAAWAAPAAAQNAPPPAPAPAPAVAPAPAAPAPPAGGYRYDEKTYVRLRVQLRYGDISRPIELTNRCSADKLWNDSDGLGGAIAKLMKADRTFSLGFSVTTPSGAVVKLTPVQVALKDSFPLGVKCNVHVENVEYISPVFAIAKVGSKTFSVEPVVYVRKKPTEDFVKASRLVADQVLKVAGAPGPLADQIGAGVENLFETSGENYTASFAVPLTVQPSDGSVTTASWTAKGVLTDEEQPFVISARLENVASIMAPDKTALDTTTFADVEPSALLGHEFLGDYQNGTLRQVDDLVTFVTRSTTDRAAFDSKKVALEADDSCNNIYKLLSNAGLSETDGSLVVWALGRTQRQIGGSTKPGENLDQIPCIKRKEAILNAVGVTLRETDVPPPPVVATFNPDLDLMRNRMELDRTLARFFVFPDGLAWQGYVQKLFVAKPALIDAGGVMFNPAQDYPGASQWRYYSVMGQAAPFLKQVGCYAYFPSPVQAPSKATPDSPSYMWLIGKTAADKEVAIRAAFAPGDRTALIAQLEISATLDPATRAQIQKARQNAPCGDNDDWKPALLFGS